MNRTMNRCLSALTVAAALTCCGNVVAAERIVSIGGAVTEILFELGLADRIVAVDSTSLYPQVATKLPDVGYTRTLSAEPILALRPDLILHVADAGPPEAFEQLDAVGVTRIPISNTPTPDGVAKKILDTARAVGMEVEGQAIVKRLEGELAGLNTLTGKSAAKPSVLFVMSFDGAAALAAGIETAADNIIRLAGGTNAGASFNGYKPLGAESVAGMNIDVLLTTERAVRVAGGLDAVQQLAVVQASGAAQRDRLVIMDPLLLLGFGPRYIAAARELAAQLSLVPGETL